jgi:hypothetical protein
VDSCEKLLEKEIGNQTAPSIAEPREGGEKKEWKKKRLKRAGARAKAGAQKNAK